jgi:hypothetical protein
MDAVMIRTLKTTLRKPHVIAWVISSVVVLGLAVILSQLLPLRMEWIMVPITWVVMGGSLIVADYVEDRRFRKRDH